MAIGDTVIERWSVTVGGEIRGPFSFDQTTDLAPGTYVFTFESDKDLVTESKSVTIPSGVESYQVDVEYYDLPDVYVADFGGHRVQKFKANGDFVAVYGTSSASSDDGDFNQPYGIAASSDGSFYVADRGNNRIQKFNSNFEYVSKWGEFDSEQAGQGKFSDLYGIAVDSSGYVYVIDNPLIQKFDSSGTFITQWALQDGTNGSPQAYGITVNPDGNIFVVDSVNAKIFKFTASGSEVSSWNTLYGVEQIAFDSDGYAYVTDYLRDMVYKLDSSGSQVDSWYVHYARGISIDSNDKLFISSVSYVRIDKYDSSGNLILNFGEYGSGDGQFNSPYGIACYPGAY